MSTNKSGISPSTDPQKVGMPTGKLFESQLLGDLNTKRIIESLGEVIVEALEFYGVDNQCLEKTVAGIVFTAGVKKGQRKYESFAAFMKHVMKNLNDKSAGTALKSEAYYDFNEFLTHINSTKKLVEDIPNLLDSGNLHTVFGNLLRTERNLSLQIAVRANPEIPTTAFSREVLSSLKQKFPGRDFILVNGLGTPMDFIQKIDFVIAVLDENKNIIRYYSYDIKTNPEVTTSIMSNVEIIMPDDLGATLEDRTKSCIDKVVQNVVERESRVTKRR